MIHTPVLLEETVELLNIKPDGIYADATVGNGGHAGRILEKLGPEGMLVGIDCDEGAVESSRQSLGKYGGRVKLFCGNYILINEFLKGLGINAIDGLLLDLGVSTLQLGEPSRGFSFQSDGPLDMRMNRGGALTAEQVVNEYPQEELEKILSEYGEERYARRISFSITRLRRVKPFKTTLELADAVRRSVPFSGKSRIHPATRTFQALRICVNDELGNIKKITEAAPSLLKSGGRMAVISFHSLEDRIAKRSFVEMKKKNVFRIITAGPVTPSEGEMNANPRSRSAKLRVAEKI
jgi:16S rRNA (cytosine1402-N4)-methyltransferase